jgi:hypothetical protein
MRKFILLLAVSFSYNACTEKKSIETELFAAFSSHLSKINSTARLDSIRILWRTPATERLSRVIDDSLLVREYNRINNQLSQALSKNADKDSIAYYRYEIRVLKQNIDIASKSIDKGDTTHSNGSLIACAYFLSINGRQLADSTLLYIDSLSILRYTSYMDSSIAKTAKISFK